MSLLYLIVNHFFLNIYHCNETKVKFHKEEFIMLTTYIDYENWLIDQMESKSSASEQLNDQELYNTVREIGNELMVGEKNWYDDDFHMAEYWDIFSISSNPNMEIGGWNPRTGIGLNLLGICCYLDSIQCTNYEQIEMFLVFTLAHERCHRTHNDMCKYNSIEEHHSHSYELRAQRAGYEAVMAYLNK